jgi:hypothetical protein
MLFSFCLKIIRVYLNNVGIILFSFLLRDAGRFWKMTSLFIFQGVCVVQTTTITVNNIEQLHVKTP